jgi:hypothetical protein
MTQAFAASSVRWSRKTSASRRDLRRVERFVWARRAAAAVRSRGGAGRELDARHAAGRERSSSCCELGPGAPPLVAAKADPRRDRRAADRALRLVPRRRLPGQRVEQEARRAGAPILLRFHSPRTC